jgi:hypothetical protein
MSSGHFTGPLIALAGVVGMTAGCRFFMARGQRRQVALYGAFAARFGLHFSHERIILLPVMYWPDVWGQYRGRDVFCRMVGRFLYPWGRLRNHHLRRNHTILALATNSNEDPVQLMRAHFERQPKSPLSADVAALVARFPESLKQRIRALYAEHKGAGIFVIGAGWVFYAEYGAIVGERELNVFTLALALLAEIAVAVE